MFYEPINLRYHVIEERVVQEHVLQQAIARQDVLAVRVLLASGADVHDAIPIPPIISPDMDNPLYLPAPSLPLDFAAECGNSEIMQLLIDYGADVNYHHKMDGHFYSALWYAVHKNHLEAAQLLLDHGAVIDVHWDFNFNPLTLCVQSNNAPMFELLVAEIDDLRPYFLTYNGGIEVRYAVEANNVEMLRLMLDKGIPVNYQGVGSFTPLMFARGKCVDLLLERGANIHLKSMHGHTAFFYTSFSCDVETAVKLLELGAFVDEQRGPECVTPFYMASCYSSDKCNCLPYLQLLLEAEADINKRCENGRTVLGRLKQLNKNPELQAWLVSQGAIE